MQGRQPSPHDEMGVAAVVAPTLLKTRDGLLEQLPVGICFSDLTGGLVRYNKRAAELWGIEPDAAHSAAARRAAFRIYDLDGALIAPDATPMHDVLATREPIRNREMTIERTDGSRVSVLASIDPLFGENGELMGAVQCFNDVTDNKRFAHEQKTLIDELNHRVKNTLATVQSLAAHSLASADASERATFDDRLLALSRVHDQLSARQWQSADLKDLLADALVPFGRGRGTTLSGGAVDLPTKVALTLALVFHELASNASRHGALRNTKGTLDVSWEADLENGVCKLDIDWRESGGPEPSRPLKDGFGLRLVERSIRQDLGGQAEVKLEPEGLRFTMAVAFPEIRRTNGTSDDRLDP